MLITAVAAVGMLCAGLLLALGVGVRSRGELAVVGTAAALLLITVVEKGLLLAAVFGPLSAGLMALLTPLAMSGWLLLDGRAGARARQGLALLRRPLPWVSPLRAPLPWAAVGAVAALYSYLGAVAVRLPPRDIDSLWYHLVSVDGWIRTGSLASPIANLAASRSLGWTVVSDSYPRDTELVSAFLSVFTHDTRLVSLTQLPFTALLLAAVYALCRRVGARPGVALCAACAVVLTPVVASQAAMAYTDIARAAVPAAAWLVLIRGCDGSDDSDDATGNDAADGTAHLCLRHLALAGALFGLGIGIKPANLYLLAAALPVALWRTGAFAGLRPAVTGAERGRAGLPGEWSAQALRRAGVWAGGRLRGLRPALAVLLRAGTVFLLPALAVGGFWYALSWRRWGSPLWPVRMGPFPGPMSMYDLVGYALPPGWRHLPLPEAVLRSWFDAVRLLDRPHWYVAWTGLLGLGWLLFLLPATALLALLALRRRPELRLAAWGVTVPLLLGTLASPGAWFARYTIPLLVAGAVAFAALFDGRPLLGAGGRVRRVRLLQRHARPLSWLLTLGLLTASCAGLVSGLRWSTYWRVEDPAQLNAAGTLSLLTQPAARRDRAGIWGSYPQAWSLPTGAAVGFCDEDPPRNWFPMLLIGQHYQRSLVDLGRCGTGSRAVQLATAHGADYVYATCASRIGHGLAATLPSGASAGASAKPTKPAVPARSAEPASDSVPTHPRPHARVAGPATPHAKSHQLRAGDPACWLSLYRTPTRGRPS